MTHLGIEQRLPGRVRLRNKNRYLVEGWIFGASRLKRLSLFVGAVKFIAKDMELFRPDVTTRYAQRDRGLFSMFSGFSIPVILEPVVACEEREIVLDAEFREGQHFIHRLGSVTIEPWSNPGNAIPLPPCVTKDGLLVVCMATYNPKEPCFKRQIESIVNQDYANWICIVSDDCSDEENKRFMRTLLAKDPRFFFIEQSDNVGFYHNFERCLELVPAAASYIALSDQDDYWYPNKLSSCVQRLVASTDLVYCDMKIVREDGTVLSETYWKNRTNYYRSEDIDLLAIANTVTGAASVFRAGLLEKILPFPPRYGDVYHDAWIAIVAAALGGIGYVDMALYDYIQYGENIIGHCDFGYRSSIGLLKVSPAVKDHERSMTTESCARRPPSLAGQLLVRARKAYSFNYTSGKHIMTIIETASLRDLDKRVIPLLRRPLSLWGLVRIHAKVVARRETTNNNEIVLLFSRLSNMLCKWCIPVIRRVVLYCRGGAYRDI